MNKYCSPTRCDTLEFPGVLSEVSWCINRYYLEKSKLIDYNKSITNRLRELDEEISKQIDEMIVR